jgi:hypothetical protein
MGWVVHAARMVQKIDKGESENIKNSIHGNLLEDFQGRCLINYFKGNGKYVYHLLQNI